MAPWVELLNRHPRYKAEFEFAIMKLMSEIMAHTITLHMLDAPGRVHRFVRKHGELAERTRRRNWWPT
jgi:cytochrome oxidase Cu insertion factor (SCO1/SenC/PrrC family)